MRKRNKIQFTITLVVLNFVILFLMNGCAVFYAPSLPNIPLFSDEDNTNLNASISSLGAEFQVAQKIFDDFAVIASYQRINNGKKTATKWIQNYSKPAWDGF